MKYLIITDYLDSVGGGYEPLGILYIASAVQAAGHEVRMIPNSYKTCTTMLIDWKPDFAAYCLYTGYHRPLLVLNRYLKERFNFISVFGGPHATFFPEIIYEEGVDLVCRGEGELAMVEMIDRISRGEDYHDVKNFWVKSNGQIYKNPVRTLEPEIEKIPFPAHEMFYQFPEARKNRIRVLITSRGCPYSCTYCYNYKIKELYNDCGVPHLRLRQVGGVIEEIKRIKAHYPIDLIYFGTDCFTTSEKWVLQFCEQYSQELRIPFTATTRPETTTEASCVALKEAGCTCLLMGFESGNEEIRRNLLNRKMTNESIVEAAEIIHRAGINLYTFNMIALPGETLDQGFDTMKINIKTKTDYTSVTIFQPYPRTKLAEYAIEHNYYDGDYDKLPANAWRKSALINPQRKELQRLRPLIALGVEFPWLTWLIRILVKLPLREFYILIWKIHKMYCYHSRVMPVKFTLKEIIKLSWKYLFQRTA